MTPVQIAYFKHFLFDKGLVKLYLSFYKRNRIKGDTSGDKKGNSVSVEEFFQQISVEDVLTKAFYFDINTNYGWDYWMDIKDKWLRYWKDNENNFTNDKYVTLKGTFAILRQNWDNTKYWELDTKTDTYTRMNMEPPIKDENLETAFDIPKIEDGNEKDKENIKAEQDDDLDGFFQVEVSRAPSRKLDNNKVTVNTRNGYRVTFSTKKSEELLKYKYNRVKFLTNPTTKEVALVFNYSEGVPVSLGTTKHKNVTIGAKDITDNIKKFFDIESDFFLLDISATIHKVNFTIVKLKNGAISKAKC